MAKNRYKHSKTKQILQVSVEDLLDLALSQVHDDRIRKLLNDEYNAYRRHEISESVIISDLIIALNWKSKNFDKVVELANMLKALRNN